MNTRTFILQVAQENGIAAERVEGIIEKLISEWYETAESLKEITDAQWSTMGIPIRLVELIKKDLFTEQKSSDQFPTLIEELSQNPSDLLQCMETLKTIIVNIIKSSDAKFRKINKNNAKFIEKVGKFSSAINYLQSLGFQINGDFLFLIKENKSILEQEINRIDEVLENARPSNFDPYKPSVVSTNFDNVKIESRENDPLLINQELQRLKSQEFPQVPRNPQILKVEAQNLQTYFRQIDQGIDLAQEDEIAQLANIQSVMRQREELSNFRSKRKNELVKAKSSVLYKVIIRIRFPDKTILQGDFSVKETTRKLYEFVGENLIQKNREFYLYEVPLRKTIKNGNHNLAPFAPASILYFSWSDIETTEAHGPFLI
ncbi:hypothetical protein SteCoe_37370 [Stentor coeruleus]|uniref:UBX domain-containing protein n=1 Tax=Stentor coeruleus TaxID=5963 RepID=A0A1R2ANH7_9CILI|nr:hypothetical protein SteCoe_37370 [Stentor coeruleus]